MIGIESEIQFENYIRIEILEDIVFDNPTLKLFNFKKAVDILIARNGEIPKLFFVEIKYHKMKHGRLGFGHAKGGGFQPEVLKTKTDYFEKNMKWILGTEDSESYWFVDNETLRNYISGSEIGQKFNNIQKKIFKDIEPKSKEQLIIDLKNWLLEN